MTRRGWGGVGVGEQGEVCSHREQLISEFKGRVNLPLKGLK